jgi:hypothetical protein
MEINEFINSIDSDLTIDGSLPLSIPKKTIMRIIKNAKKWFYKNYELSLEEGYLYVAVNDTAFVCDNYLVVDESIEAIYGVHPVNGKGFNHADFSFTRLAMLDYHKSSGGGNSVDYYVAKNMELDMKKFLFGKRISFDYNSNTQRLFVRGWRPNEGGLICDCFIKIPDAKLFDDGYFFRYVLAMSKITVARLMGTITMPLVGGASIDFSLIQSEGENDLEKIKEEIENMQGVDYIMKGH